MKKFLVKVFILAAIVSTLLLCVNFLYVNTAYYKNLNDMRKFSEVPEHIDVVNFGASHSACAFNWSGYTQFAGTNMALGSQTLVYDEALFRYYFDCLDENSTVLLEVMFKSLYEKEQDTPPYGTNITRYYQVLPKDFIRQWNLPDAVKYGYLPVLGNRQEAVANIISEWFGGDGSAGELERQQQTGQVLTGEPTRVLDGWEEEAMNAEGKRRAESFMAQSGNQEHGEQYEALIRIIEKCKENNIQVILVTAPTLPCFYTGYDKEFMDRFYQDMEEISQKYDIPYLDYTGDERFLADYRWYSDTDHLNGYGSRYFTQEFLKDNQEILRFMNR